MKTNNKPIKVGRLKMTVARIINRKCGSNRHFFEKSAPALGR